MVSREGIFKTDKEDVMASTQKAFPTCHLIGSR
jgi:hypothetical protein